MRIYLFMCLTVAMFLTSTGFTLPGGKGRNAAELYRQYCLSCHGSDGRSKTSKGRRNHARDLTDAAWQDNVTDERIFNSIMNGRNTRGNMPGFNNKVSAEEADALVDFVRRFKS